MLGGGACDLGSAVLLLRMARHLWVVCLEPARLPIGLDNRGLSCLPTRLDPFCDALVKRPVHRRGGWGRIAASTIDRGRRDIWAPKSVGHARAVVGSVT